VAAPIAGFLAGLTIMIESRFRSKYLAVLALSRLVDATLLMLQEKEILPKSKHYDMILWVLCNSLVMFCISYASDCVNIDVSKFYTGVARLTL
jgi:hypothetical protein